MKKAALWLVLIGLIVLSGCETMGGLGRDMKKAGNWVEQKAK